MKDADSGLLRDAQGNHAGHGTAGKTHFILHSNDNHFEALKVVGEIVAVDEGSGEEDAVGQEKDEEEEEDDDDEEEGVGPEQQQVWGVEPHTPMTPMAHVQMNCVQQTPYVWPTPYINVPQPQVQVIPAPMPMYWATPTVIWNWERSVWERAVGECITSPILFPVC